MSATRFALLAVPSLLLTLAACGDGGGGETLPPVEPGNEMVWIDVATGTHHSCAVNAQNVAYCWGSSYVGQLGHGTTANAFNPTPVAGSLRFRAIAAGVDHTCGITTAGAVYCWGLNNTNQLGDGTATDRPAPVQVPGLAGIRALSLGIATSYAMAEDGRVFCWGFGCPGTTNPGGDALPIQVTLLPATQGMATGGTHWCGALPAQGVVCWGEGLHLSLGRSQDGFDPIHDYNVVLPEIAFRAAAAANDHSCGLTTAGAVYCWGDNSHGQLGLGVQDPAVDIWSGRAPGAAVTGGITFAQIYARGLITCGLTADGTAYCWGNNSTGQLGDGTTTTRTAPTPVSGGHRFSRLSIAGYKDAGNGRILQHVCGITTAGRLYCWGAGDFGAAGPKAGMPATTPVELDDPA